MDCDGYQRIRDAGLSAIYASNTVEVATGIWTVLHKPSGHCHRLKLAQGAKRRHFLRQEAVWLRALEGRGIARVHKLHEQEHQTLLITDFLKGITLAQCLREAAAGGSHSVSGAKPLFDLITRCHQQGIVHCDIKPNNILVDEQEIHLIDFANAGRVSEPLSDRPYRGYSPTYSLPSLQRGFGNTTTLIDWFGFLVVLRLISGERPPLIDWRVECSVRAAFEEIIDRSDLPETDKAFLHGIVDQLVSQREVQLSAVHALTTGS